MMKHLYSLLLISLLVFISSCSKKKEEAPKPKIEPKVEIIEPVIEEELVVEKNPLIYFVQIGAYKNANVELENSVDDLHISHEDGLIKYRLGEFSTYKEAGNFKSKISTSYSDAFIVATNNDVRIYIGDALVLSNEN